MIGIERRILLEITGFPNVGLINHYGIPTIGNRRVANAKHQSRDVHREMTLGEIRGKS